MIEVKTTGSFFTNSYIISEDNKCIIIDPGLSYKNAYLYIKERYEVVAIFITHAHLDHIDGLEYYLDLPIYMSEKTANNLDSMENTLYYMIGRVPPFNRNNLDIRIVKNGDKINLLGHEFKVITTPGHTDDSICYLMDNKELFSGDTLFNLSIGRTDFSNSSISAMNESLAKLMKLDDSINVYPGHEGITTIGYERKYNPYIND